MVFNYENYPHLTSLFDKLDVPIKKSDMSFGASINDGEIEYGLQTLSALFADKKNLMKPGFWKMIADIFRFNAKALEASRNAQLTLGDLLDELKMGTWFRDYFLLPLSGAIWSTCTTKMLDFPAETLLTFFRNHGLLSTTGQYQWWTVDGGSREYVQRLERAIQSNGATIRTNAAVSNVKREGNGAYVKTQHGEAEYFDTVIFACHSDQALSILADPTPDERRTLGALKYKANRVVLHDDVNHMPKRKTCWASWVYLTRKNAQNSNISISYWMNRLQSIPETTPLFVTLNPIKSIREEAIFDETTLYHPQFDRAAIRAQKELKTIQGLNSTFYCGAYTRYGFHEDGLLSAVQAFEALNKTPALV
ncbi:MAG: FAD-dependent oxidoreductase [Pseudomonadota bacterium]